MNRLISFLILSYLLVFASDACAQTDSISSGNVAGAEAPDILYEGVKEYPKFKGDLLEWLYQNVKYPESTVDICAEGRVIVQFTIHKDGSISDAKIVRGVHPLIDNEVLRVVSIMPAWEPAIDFYDNVVNYRYTMPVTFKIEHEQETEETNIK